MVRGGGPPSRTMFGVLRGWWSHGSWVRVDGAAAGPVAAGPPVGGVPDRCLVQVLRRSRQAHLEQQILHSALSQFPGIGTQIRSSIGLRGSGAVVVVRVLGALYGSLGLAQATQNVCGVERADR